MERFTVSLSERVEEQALTAATSIRRKITVCCASSCVLNPVSAALWASPPIVLSVVREHGGQVNVSSIDPPAAAEAAIDSDQRSHPSARGSRRSLQVQGCQSTGAKRWTARSANPTTSSFAT